MQYSAHLPLALLCWLLLLPLPLAAEVFELAAGEVCLDCHDDLQQQKVRHPVIEESDSCLLCHQQPQASRHAFTAMPRDLGGLCGDCHDAFAGKSRHDPVAAGDCTACHDPHQAQNRALLKKTPADLCLQCHTPFTGKVEHGPVAAGECLACHTPHASTESALLQQPQPGLCLGCHNKRLPDENGVALENIAELFNNDKVHQHPAFADGRCTDCHRPHAGEHVRLLNDSYPDGGYAAYSKAAYALCFQCHDTGAFASLLTREATAFRNGELNLHYRHVNRDKGRVCGHCHSPHGSIQPALVKPFLRFGKREMTQFFTATETGGSCQTACHTKVSYDRNEAVDNRLRVSPWK